MLRRSGRRTARHSNNADAWGRLRETRFDLPAEAPPYWPSPQEQANAEFDALSQQDQDSLTGWIVASISKASPYAPYDGRPIQNIIRSSVLARQATQDSGRPVSAFVIAGACLDLGFETVTSPRSGTGLLICAVWKES